jgi:uncharacterized protein YlxP (DUF503 family)
VKVGALKVEVRVPGVSSLKEKRQVIKSVKDRIRHRFNASIAEVDHQDKWQRAALGVAVVGTDGGYVRGALDELLRFIRGARGLEVTFHETEIL